MVDLRERLAKKKLQKATNPIDIYNSLDRMASKGELRKAQKEILENWYKYRKDDKDLIIKLSTGRGKTLIGLLILQAKINNGEGPCLYLCPDNYLVEQTCIEAKNFGIDFCTGEGDLPLEFENGEKILITNVNKLFNAKTKFKIKSNSIPVNTIVFDDSHACLDIIQSCFTIVIERKSNKNLFEKFINLFEKDLENQGQATLEAIKNSDAVSYLPVPYWSWIDHQSDVIKMLSPFSNEKFLTFTWDLVKDKLDNCICLISGNKIEITPYLLPLEKFGSFYNAKNRIFMSATVNNDSFFIKHLNISEKTIKNPLTVKNDVFTGEKMILAPSLIDQSLDTDYAMTSFIRKQDNSKVTYGICVLSPCFKMAEAWAHNGAKVVDYGDIGKAIESLKKENFDKTIVFANRYDGLDLPDNACRILIFDGLPYASNLSDIYYEECLSDTEITNTKIIQKIEQGLGRNVRGERDYGAILLFRNELVRYVMTNKYKKYFSLQTQKQIEIGKELTNLAKDEVDEIGAGKALDNLLKKIIKREEDWKEYYYDGMKDLSEDTTPKILTELLIQRQAEYENYIGKNNNAVDILRQYLDKNKENISDNEKGWYLQQIARYLYKNAKFQSIKTQISAHEKNNLLLKPNADINIKLLKSEKINQALYIKKYIEKYSTPSELELEINEILDFMDFGIDSKKFENSIMKIGKFLGFASEQPDQQYREGPDNLWAVAPSEYFVIECKNQIFESRGFLSQDEIGQMNNTIGWFQKNYQKHNGTYIMFAPTNIIDNRVAFVRDVNIIRKTELKKLRNNILAFTKDLISNDFENISSNDIYKLLKLHKLNYKDFHNYFKKPFDTLVQKEAKEEI